MPHIRLIGNSFGDPPNTYATQTQADDYMDLSLDADAWAALSQNRKIRLLIAAFRTLEAQAWQGTFSGGTGITEQAAFPRSGLVCDGKPVPDDSVPERILNAQIELANSYREASQATLAVGGTTSRERTVRLPGGMSVEYFDGSYSQAAQSRFLLPSSAQRLIACFLVPGESGEAFGTDGETQFVEGQNGLVPNGFY